jgi:hypothetical protein
MSIMGRRILRLIGVSAVAIAVPQLASAMGPTSAAQKNSPQATSDKAVANCAASEGTCPKPHLRSKSRRTGSHPPA